MTRPQRARRHVLDPRLQRLRLPRVRRGPRLLAGRRELLLRAQLYRPLQPQLPLGLKVGIIYIYIYIYIYMLLLRAQLRRPLQPQLPLGLQVGIIHKHTIRENKYTIYS